MLRLNVLSLGRDEDLGRRRMLAAAVEHEYRQEEHQGQDGDRHQRFGRFAFHVRFSVW